MNISFFIAEDSKIDRDILIGYIDNWAKKANNIVEFTVTNKVSYMIPPEAMACDVALLDIEIPEISGIEFAKELRKYNKNIIICFITSHSQFAINGYEVSALDYIVKPVNQTRLNKTLDKIANSLQKNIDRLIRLDASNGYYTIDTKSIMYVESDKHSCIFHMIEEEKQINIPISKIEDLLIDYDMCRIHRSYIVNLNYVASFKSQHVQISNGDSIPVGRSKMKDVQSLFLKFFGG